MNGSMKKTKKFYEGMLKGWVRIALSLACLFVFMALFCVETHAYNEDMNDMIVEANEALKPMLIHENIMATVYLCDELDVKSDASDYSETIGKVKSGQLVYILEADMDEDYKLWTKVEVRGLDSQYVGYVRRDNLACSNLRYLDWESEYCLAPQFWNGSMQVMLMSVGDEEEENNEPEIPAIDLYPDVKLFPESYQKYLLDLKAIHPNWTFVAVNTGLDFSASINKQVGNKSWVSGGLYKSYCEGPTGQGNWYYASPETIEFYMDPRNALTEDRIFQFEQLTYNPECHNRETLASFLSGTFMEDGKQIPGLNAHPGNWYADYIMVFCNSEAENINLSPYHLASRIIQEQGKQGSVMISGTVPGYEGLYNYFNIGATGKTDADVIKNGLEYARSHGWTSGYYALLGGAKFLYNGYVSVGQDTLYAQKFNYLSSQFTHQYMQNITAPTTEGTSTFSMYKKNENFDSVPFVFKIPVYQNMPETPLPKPITTTKFMLTLPEDYAAQRVSATPEVWVDGVKKSSVSRNGYLVIDSGSDTAKVALVNKYGADGFESGMYIWFLDYKNGAYTVTREAEMDDLLTYWGFSIRIVEPSGIRFMSGIKDDTKNRLISSGIDGYKLKEYGTLVTIASLKEADGTDKMFVKGASGVASGASYGASTNYVENKTDIYAGETRFAAVFKGLPVSAYKTDFNFRSYAIVGKDGVDRIIYGPYYGKNIYDLAKRVLATNKYPVGSDNYNFINQLIYDSDHQVEENQ